MKNLKKFSFSLFLITLTAFVFISVGAVRDKLENTEGETVPIATIGPQGIFTALSLYIKGDETAISAVVKNDVSVFPSTVNVTVELYASEKNCESYKDMTLVGSKHTYDLNMGDVIVASASTNGMRMFWQARMYYSIDYGTYKEKTTGVVLYTANGKVMKKRMCKQKYTFLQT